MGADPLGDGSPSSHQCSGRTVEAEAQIPGEKLQHSDTQPIVIVHFLFYIVAALFFQHI